MGCERCFGLLAPLLFYLTFGEFKLGECLILGLVLGQGCLSCGRCWMCAASWELGMCGTTTLEEEHLTLGERVLRPIGVITT